MATIKDIARITGYSIGTVSRVMNHQDVSDKARKEIEQVIEVIIPELSEPSFRTFEASVPRRQGQSDSDSSFRWPRPPFRNTTATFHASKTRPDQSQVGFHSLSGVAVSRSLYALTCLQGS